MCIAVPAEVISVDGPTALVDVYGKRFSVSLMMMSETVQAGDFVALAGAALCRHQDRAGGRPGGQTFL